MDQNDKSNKNRRGNRNLLGAVMCLTHEMVETIAHFYDDISHLAELVAAVKFSRCEAEIASAQTLASRHHGLQRMGDGFGDPDPNSCQQGQSDK